MSHTLLLEIGCEELPSSSLKALGEGLHQTLLAQLAERELSHGDSRWFATPRRLAVLVEALADKAPDREQESLGPPVAQAKDDAGNWSKAAEGFAKRCGVSPAELEVITTPKGDRLGIRQTQAGVATVDCIADAANSALQALPIAKRMRWGTGRMEFARPVHWVVLMLDARADFGQVMGLESGNVTYGHRFHAPQAIRLNQAGDYEGNLRDARVVADFAERRATIREQVTDTAAALSARALIDNKLLDEVTSLVEWPVALAGRFDDEFLQVPSEALISSMQSHQKYFPVVGKDEEAALQPHFITISNIESKDPAQIVSGNERVIRPRLADAAFFYQQDLKNSLASQIERLDSVVFQKQLGSLGDRARRIEALAGQLAAFVGADAVTAQRAGLLSKADLVSEMVQEFADMQGIAGAYYARNDGEEAAVAEAIQQHYWPLGAGSALPEHPVSRAVALADRLDTLVGIFGIGQKPSGSRDPFGLRRASIAVLRLLIEGDCALDLREALSLAVSGYPEGVLTDDVVDLALEYALDRLPALFEAEQLPVEVFRAVRSTGVTEPLDLSRRVHAVQAFQQREEAGALAAANKRVANILAKVEGGQSFSEVSANLLELPQEKALQGALDSAAAANSSALGRGDYTSALANLAALRAPVDDFFDGVMVNAEDPALRNNRLNLLHQLRREFLAIADISQLAG